MLSHKERIYIAELRVPTFFYVSAETRQTLPNPDVFEVNKGYWVVHPQDEQSNSEWYAEVFLVVEFLAATLKDAENHALKVGKTFGSIVSAYGGQPLGATRLHRVACTSFLGELKSQHNYWYGNKSHMLSVFNPTVDEQFRSYVQVLSSMDDQTRYRVLAAVHWYGISLTANDPTVSCVAAWTGLESIGLAVNSVVHPSGTKALCQICENEPGRKRDRKLAGIEHAFRFLAKEPPPEAFPEGTKGLIDDDLIDGFFAEEASNLRNNVVHGLKDIESLSRRCTEVGRHLIHVLNASILIAMGSATYSWTAGHYESHPGGRVSIRFKDGLARSPFLGEWVDGFGFTTQPGDHGNGEIYVATAEFEWPVPNSIAEYIESKSEELFERDAGIFRLDDRSMITGLAKWHSRPPEPVWEDFSPPGSMRKGQNP